MDTKLRKTYFYIGLIIPIIVYIPIFILQDDSILPILDFLDGEYGWLKVLKDENLLFVILLPSSMQLVNHINFFHCKLL